MPMSSDYAQLDPLHITVERDARQRREVSTEGLLESVRDHGIFNPLILTRTGRLVAGERRLTAALELHLPLVPVRYVDELSPAELGIIELEENVKRQDLSWQDSTTAIARLHALHCALAPSWTQTDTAEAVSLSPGHVAKCLRVASELTSPALAKAETLMAAYNLLARTDSRVLADATADIMEAGLELSRVPAAGTPRDPSGSIPPSLPPPDSSILQADFLQWAPQYTGPKFNFIHCDFPYGINVFAGPQSGRNTSTTYADTPEIYWQLISALGANIDRLATPSCHVMFWFSMSHYSRTLRAFREALPGFVFSAFPLVWFKSDNVGLLPDSNRGPRRVYETAFMASREDRQIVKPVANCYAAPTDRALHPSAKPEPMLRHFFTLFVDQTTRMLDPTCGSGTALRAAESMGATQVLGLELDETHCAAARGALRNFRLLRGTTPRAGGGR